jgi:hypothetical protein
MTMWAVHRALVTSLLFVAVFFVLPGMVRAGGGALFLIHVQDEDRYDAVPELALSALERGRRAAVLFDSRAVRLMRIGHWYGGDTTPLDKMALPETRRALLAKRLGLSLASTPGNHGDLLRFLRGRGVELYASVRAMEMHGVTEDASDTVVTPLGEGEMVDLLGRASTYVSY